MTEDQIRWRLEIGALIREYPGVYRVGHHAPSVEARYMAAVKACGRGAMLSGRAAAHLLGLLKGAAPQPEVIAPGKKRIPGVKTRRSRDIQATEWRGIPVTTVPRTLIDIAGDLSEEDLGWACHQAGVRFRTTPRQVEAVLAKRPRTKGAGKLRRMISGDSHVILSRLEERFIKLLREAGLPLPCTNRLKGAHYIDCRWPEHKLTVELDSYQSARHPCLANSGLLAEREAYARGDEHRRYVWSDVFETPAETLTELQRALGRVETWTQARSR